MTRYIDKDEALKKVSWDTGAYQSINMMLSVDAVEVVRCKDCKHWERDVIFQDGWCRGRHQGDPNWFCADGERRENEQQTS